MASTTNIEVVVKPTLEEIRKRLEDKRKAVIDLKTPMARASVLLDQWVQQNFRTEGGKVGGWEPFAKNKAGIPYVEAKNPSRAPAKLLQDTGRLRSSFYPFADKTSAGIGSGLPYSKPHHEGTSRLPMRQLLPDKGEAKQTVIASVKDLIGGHISEALKK